MSAPLFPLGAIVAMPVALEAGTHPAQSLDLLSRHGREDRGRSRRRRHQRRDRQCRSADFLGLRYRPSPAVRAIRAEPVLIPEADRQ
jgi:hypothetical protein